MKAPLPLLLLVALMGCGGPPPSAPEVPSPEPAAAADPSAAAEEARRGVEAGEFQINKADKRSRPKQTRIKATATEAALRLFVLDKDKGPVEGVVVSVTAPSGEKRYTEETDARGYTELLVPNGQTYALTYLSLGKRGVNAKVKVDAKPNLNLKLTIRHRGLGASGRGGGASPKAKEAGPPRFVLEDVQFATGEAKLTAESYARLDAVVEYMTYKRSARVEISGHTDNVGGAKVNKRLSQQRADTVKRYIVSKGIDAARLDAIGYGDERPIAPNDSVEGRQRNRRIEATEL